MPQDSNSLYFEDMPRPQEFERHRTPANQAKTRDRIPEGRIFFISIFAVKYMGTISLFP